MASKKHAIPMTKADPVARMPMPAPLPGRALAEEDDQEERGERKKRDEPGQLPDTAGVGGVRRRLLACSIIAHHFMSWRSSTATVDRCR